MKTTLRNALLLFLTLLPAGCIKDDTSECDSVVELNVSAEVETTSPSDTFNATGVYVFDQAGLFVGLQWVKKAEQSNGQVIDLSLPKGTYTLITWCGSNFDTDYQVVAQTPAGFTTQFIKGVTRLEDMRLKNKTDLPVIDTPPGNLFWGIVSEVVVSEGVTRIKADTHLVKSTNQVEVVLPGRAENELRHTRVVAESERYDVSLTAQGGVYKFDHSLDPTHAPSYTYLPYAVDTQGTDLRMKLKTMRLFIDQPALLEVKDRTTDTVLYAADLIGLICQNPAYRTQEDLDKAERFEIVITVGDTDPGIIVSVTVNGWEVINLTPTPNR